MSNQDTSLLETTMTLKTTTNSSSPSSKCDSFPIKDQTQSIILEGDILTSKEAVVGKQTFEKKQDLEGKSVSLPDDVTPAVNGFQKELPHKDVRKESVATGLGVEEFKNDSSTDCHKSSSSTLAPFSSQSQTNDVALSSNVSADKSGQPHQSRESPSSSQSKNCNVSTGPICNTSVESLTSEISHQLSEDVDIKSAKDDNPTSKSGQISSIVVCENIPSSNLSSSDTSQHSTSLNESCRGNQSSIDKLSQPSEDGGVVTQEKTNHTVEMDIMETDEKTIQKDVDIETNDEAIDKDVKMETNKRTFPEDVTMKANKETIDKDVVEIETSEKAILEDVNMKANEETIDKDVDMETNEITPQIDVVTSEVDEKSNQKDVHDKVTSNEQGQTMASQSTPVSSKSKSRISVLEFGSVVSLPDSMQKTDIDERVTSSDSIENEDDLSRVVEKSVDLCSCDSLMDGGVHEEGNSRASGVDRISIACVEGGEGKAQEDVGGTDIKLVSVCSMVSGDGIVNEEDHGSGGGGGAYDVVGNVIDSGNAGNESRDVVDKNVDVNKSENVEDMNCDDVNESDRNVGEIEATRNSGSNEDGTCISPAHGKEVTPLTSNEDLESDEMRTIQPSSENGEKKMDEAESGGLSSGVNTEEIEDLSGECVLIDEDSLLSEKGEDEIKMGAEKNVLMDYEEEKSSVRRMDPDYSVKTKLEGTEKDEMELCMEVEDVKCIDADSAKFDNVKCVDADSAKSDNVKCVDADSAKSDNVKCVDADSAKSDNMKCIDADSAKSDNVKCVNSKCSLIEVNEDEKKVTEVQKGIESQTEKKVSEVGIQKSSFKDILKSKKDESCTKPQEVKTPSNILKDVDDDDDDVIILDENDENLNLPKKEDSTNKNDNNSNSGNNSNSVDISHQSDDVARKRSISVNDAETSFPKRSRLDSQTSKTGIDSNVESGGKGVCVEVMETGSGDSTTTTTTTTTTTNTTTTNNDGASKLGLTLTSAALRGLIMSSLKAAIWSHKLGKTLQLEERMSKMESASSLWKESGKHLEKSVEELTKFSKEIDMRNAQSQKLKHLSSRNVGIQVTPVSSDNNQRLPSHPSVSGRLPAQQGRSLHQSGMPQQSPVPAPTPSSSSSQHRLPPSVLLNHNGTAQSPSSTSQSHTIHHKGTQPVRQIVQRQQQQQQVRPPGTPNPYYKPSPEQNQIRQRNRIIPQNAPLPYNNNHQPRPPVANQSPNQVGRPGPPRQPVPSAANNSGVIDLTDEDDTASKISQRFQNNPSTLTNNGNVNRSSSSAVYNRGPTLPPANNRVNNLSQQQRLGVANTAVSPSTNQISGSNRPGYSSTPRAGMGGSRQVTNTIDSNRTNSSGKMSLPPSIHNKHPAPFPAEVNSVTVPMSAKLKPPKPSLKISRVVKGIVLSWNMPPLNNAEVISSYQLYAYQESSGVPTSSSWKKVGDVKALPLPMACTLTQFQEGNKYHFAVRAIDQYGRWGDYSDPSSLFLYPDGGRES